MIFGEKNSFAIEIHITKGKGHIFGQYCYWLNDQMIGDIDQTTLLSAIAGDLEKIILSRGNRIIQGIGTFSSDKITDALIHNSLEKRNSHFHIDEDKLDHININYFNTPCMDGYYIFLIENSSYDWFLAKDLLDQKCYNYKMPKDIFYKLIEDAKAHISKCI